MRQRTEYLNLRILPAVKEALRALAGKEYRSIASMIEVMVRERCRDLGIAVAEQEKKPKKQSGGAGEEKRKSNPRRSRGSKTPS